MKRQESSDQEEQVKTRMAGDFSYNAIAATIVDYKSVQE